MYFRVNEEQKEVVDTTVDVLQHDGVVLYPSWSPWFWALACDATSHSALDKILSMKRVILPWHGIVFVQDEVMLERYITPIPYFVRDFLHHQDREVTVVYNQRWQITPAACCFGGKPWVRTVTSVDVPSVQMTRHILRLFGKPIFVTTIVVDDANMLLPRDTDEISPLIKKTVNYISPMTFAADEKWEYSMVITYEDAWSIAIMRK